MFRVGASEKGIQLFYKFSGIIPDKVLIDE